MGVLPLQLPDGESARSLGLSGEETFAIGGIADAVAAVASGEIAGRAAHVTAARAGGDTVEFDARVRIDTPREADYYRHGGILQYVLRQLLAV
jgi:aconitate hydratase